MSSSMNIKLAESNKNDERNFSLGIDMDKVSSYKKNVIMYGTNLISKLSENIA